MAAMFVMALSVPEAFDDLDGGLDGPVVIAFAYLAVRVLHLAIFWLAARTSNETGPARAAHALRAFPVRQYGDLLVASQFSGTAQTLMWVGALIVDYVGVILGGASGWRLRSASHFAERHGLIVIVALGESIVAIGVGVADLPISWPIIAAAVLGLVVAACLWWAYFDVVSIVAERVLRRLEGEERTRIARDAYSYLHLPMVAGHRARRARDRAGPPSVRPLHRRGALARSLADRAADVALRRCRALPVRPRRVQVPNVGDGDRPPPCRRGAALRARSRSRWSFPRSRRWGSLSAVLVAMIASEAIRYAEAREQVRHEEAGPEVHRGHREADQGSAER